MMMRSFLINRIKAFGPALNGLLAALKQENAMKVHALASIMVLLFCLLFDIKSSHCLLLALACIAVLTVELINTAIEKTCDLISTQTNIHIKFIKDAAAAAVLLAVVGALAVGVYVAEQEFHYNK